MFDDFEKWRSLSKTAYNCFQVVHQIKERVFSHSNESKRERERERERETQVSRTCLIRARNLHLTEWRGGSGQSSDSVLILCLREKERMCATNGTTRQSLSDRQNKREKKNIVC